MLPMLTKHTAITAALLATLTLSACGKSKDEIVTAPPQSQTQPTKPADKAAETKTADKKGTDTSGQLGAELPDPHSSQPPAPGPVTKTPKAPTAPKTQVTPPAPPAMPPIKKDEPVAKAPPAKGPVDKMPGTIVDVNKIAPQNGYKAGDASVAPSKESVAKRFTGGTEHGLFFTSSSTDTLMSFLRDRNNRVDENSRKANIAAAASVVSAHLTMDQSTQNVTVSLKVKEGDEVKDYAVAGTHSFGTTASLMKTSSPGNVGARALRGTIKCLDAGGGCETIFARLQIGSTGSSAIINVVFRNSGAKVYANFDKVNSNDPNTIRIEDFLTNGAKERQTDDKAKYVRMNSFEVVNGRSEVMVSIMGSNDQLIAFKAPLLSERFSAGVDVKMSKVGGSQARYDYAEMIGAATMVENNGLGKIKAKITMKESQYGRDVFEMTFTRKVKELIELTEENMK